MEKDTVDHIINSLRLGTVTWSGRNQCLNRGRKQKLIGKTIKGKEKFLWERKCDGPCGNWYYLKDKILEVDHIVEIGPFKGDWADFIKRMYCDQSNLQALCTACHSRKTSKFNSTLRFERKNTASFDDALEAL